MHVQSAILGKTAFIIIISLYLSFIRAVPIISDEYSDFDGYNENSAVLEELLLQGIYINTCSPEVLRIAGFTDKECEAIIQHRNKEIFSNISDLETLIPNSDAVYNYRYSFRFNARTIISMYSRNKSSCSTEDKDYSIALKQNITFNNNSIKILSYKGFNDDDLKAVKSITCYSEQKNLNYVVGDYYPNFGRGLIFEATGRDENKFYPVNSFLSLYHLRGFGISYSKNDIMTGFFSGYLNESPTLITEGLGLNDKEKLNTYNSIIGWRGLCLLSGFKDSESSVKNPDKYHHSLSYTCSPGTYKLKTELTFEDKPSISAELNATTDRFRYNTSFDLVRNAEKHPFSSFYNNFRNQANFTEYNCKVTLTEKKYSPYLKLRYRNSCDNYLREILEQTGAKLRFDNQ
ncbi:MAG: hypothetical protein JXR56_01505, partial [Candidatus Cloacimonetes bacterium]|nr:hypothetical protein [Candidatus Cloacimonadota bacterium]